MMVELGGGTSPHPRADVVIDTRHPKSSFAQDAALAPWRMFREQGNLKAHGRILGESVDEVYASHFLEHIPKGEPLLVVMNEAHRVLKPGGSLTILLPLVGYTDSFGMGALVTTSEAWADPTHVSEWWLPDSLFYFSEATPQHADYGILPWRIGPRWGETAITDALVNDWTSPADPIAWWGVRGGWEGVARLIKPEGTQ